MSIDYSAVLTANYPGAQWALNGDSYEGLTWLDDTPQPTQAELETEDDSLENFSQVMELSVREIEMYNKTLAELKLHSN
jgi:hypothetical protein